MRQIGRVALIVLVLLIAVLGGYAGWTRIRLPQSAAIEDPDAVWIALLKGFSGDVVYVGSDDMYAYFHIGRVFWSYYKVRACAAGLPKEFSVGNGGAYVVQFQLQPGNKLDFSHRCAHYEGRALGDLARSSVDDA